MGLWTGRDRPLDLPLPKQAESRDGVRERLRALADQRRRLGYRRLTILLRREGLRVNHKRVYRLYREEGLAVRQRRRKRIHRTTTAPFPPATHLNQRWTMDFIEDRLVTSRKFRTFNVIDAFSRRGLASEVDTSLPGCRVVQVLNRLADQRGRPEELVLDNGPEFIGRVLDQWADTHAVTLTDARRIIEAWRQDYNMVRPHSALGYMTPDEFEQREYGKHQAVPVGGAAVGGAPREAAREATVDPPFPRS